MILRKVFFLSGLLSCTLILLMVTACHKSKDMGINLADFPNKIGDQWVYFVQDSLNHLDDTLTVTVISASTLNGHAALLWQYSYSSGLMDTLESVITGDTINYYTTPPFPNLSFALLFPIIAGSNWKDNAIGKYSVSSLSSYSYNGQNYSHIFVETHTSQSFGYTLSDDIYVAAKIGIVYRKIKEFNTQPTINQTWNLINYRIN